MKKPKDNRQDSVQYTIIQNKMIPSFVLFSNTRGICKITVEKIIVYSCDIIAENSIAMKENHYKPFFLVPYI